MIDKKKIIYRVISLVALLAVMITIFCLSHEDATESKETSIAVASWFGDLLGNIPDDVIRTIAHCIEFAALGFLVYNALYSFKGFISPLISIGLAFTYSVSDEIHQYFVPGRAFQLIDLAVDLTGIVIGTLAIFILLKLITKHKKNCDSK